MRKIIAMACLILTSMSSSWANGLEFGPPAGNWNKVQTLAPNTTIILELKDRGEISGEFLRLTEKSLVINGPAGEETYLKTDVARIKCVRAGSRVRNAAIVGGILFGLGFGLGYAIAPTIGDDDTMRPGERASAGAGVGGIFGGVAAAIALARRPGLRTEIIYIAK